MEDKKLNMLVQKANPLLSLCQSDMTLEEFKILDLYLAHINSHDESTRDVSFSQSTLTELLGIDRIRANDLRRRLKHLLGTVIDLGNTSSGKEVKQITLFSMAVSKKEKSGKWYVNLRCTDDAMKYVFDIETVGYIRYRINKILRLKSRYSYCLYMYLLHNAFRVKWEESVDKLKEALCCTDVPRYQEFKYFNREVLQSAFKELTEKECLKFTFAPVKEWRTVLGVEFLVLDLMDGKAPVQDVQDVQEGNYSDDFNSLVGLVSEACNNEFSKPEVEHILSLISSLPLQHELGPDIARYHYVNRLYTKLNTMKDVKKKYPYFLSMIQSDIDKNYIKK